LSSNRFAPLLATASSFNVSAEGEEPVRFESRGRIAIIELNRPRVRNAVNGALARGLEEALDRLEDDPELWIGILTHTGPVFSAGADLNEVVAGRFRELSTTRGGFGGLVRRERRKPLIAAVDGAALGGGCEFALACDIVIASSASTFGLPEVKRSLTAAAGGLIRLPLVVAKGIAMRMALTGEPISAEDALRYGLVTELVEPGTVVTAAMALAEKIAQNAPLAVQASRRVLSGATTLAESEAWALSDGAAKEVARTEDANEGPRAFLERRLPDWKAR
jgi:enoyl-CoA hydratase